MGLHIGGRIGTGVQDSKKVYREHCTAGLVFGGEVLLQHQQCLLFSWVHECNSCVGKRVWMLAV